MFVGAAAYSVVKVNRKDFVSIREELDKKADEKEINRLKEELRRLHTTNTSLSRCIILLQEDHGSGSSCR
jgi:hypothetical protein